MEDWFQTLSEWASWGENLVFSGHGAANCRGVRCPMIRDACRDACLPRYQATSVDTLEQQRGRMCLALAGQLTVVTFRLVTGHFSGGAVGLFIFIVGNNARCSLRSSLLTSFIVLGTTAGALDVLDLLREILGFGTGFFALPFAEHLSQNLTAISLLLAPVTEFAGAQAAWDSYLRPSMLFEQAAGQDAGSSASAPPWSQHPLAAAVGQALYDPHGGLGFAQLATPPPRSRQPRVDPWPASPAPLDLRCRMQDHCFECGAAVPKGDCWYGTGHYAEKAYCHRCWSAWAVSQPAG